MGVLFVATAAAVVALVLALHSAWSQRRGRAAAALRLQDERLLSARRRETAVARRRAALRTALPFPFGYLNRRLKQGAIAMSVQTVVVLAAIGAVVCWAGAAMVLGNGWISRAALLGGLWAPVIWVERQAERRREAIATEMERVTAALEGAVSAGMNAYEALVEVGVSTGGILGPELLRVVEDADRLGMSEALVLLGQRLPCRRCNSWSLACASTRVPGPTSPRAWRAWAARCASAGRHRRRWPPPRPRDGGSPTC